MNFSTYLEKITGVSVYPLISLVLFTSFLVLVTCWIYSIDKNEIRRIENLPLEDN